jgi:predicted Fe-Mo cluster-binding NifX family protein
LKKKIVIPAEDANGLNAKLSKHFGRAPYFIVVELDENCSVSNVQTVSNEGEYFGGVGHSSDQILQLKPNAVITYGMGPRALNTFREAGVAVLKANADIVKEVVEAYGQGALEEFIEDRYCTHHY